MEESGRSGECGAALIMGTRVIFGGEDGIEYSGYLAKAAAAQAPAVIVVPEWWGLQDQIKGICDRFAAAGYEALAPDLFRGKVIPYHDTAAADREMKSLNFSEATDKTIAAAARYLKQSGAKVALTGFCLGGAVAILGAMRLPELDAAVCFYGLPSIGDGQPVEFKVPFQAHFANIDDWCTPAAVDRFESAVRSSHPVEIFRYDAAHGFMNEERPNAHQREVAEQAWARTLEFLRNHLG